MYTVFTQSWQVEYSTPDSFDQENWLKAYFRITNNSGSTVPMSELTIRYWYTLEGGGMKLSAAGGPRWEPVM